MSLEESMAKQNIPVATAPPPPAAPSPSPQPAPAPELIPPAPAPPAPPAPPPEMTRSEKADAVLNFSSDLSVMLLETFVTSQGAQMTPQMDNFAKLSDVERRRLGRFAPAAYPYVELAESKMDQFPMIGLAIFGIGLAAAFTAKMKVFKDHIATTKAARGDAPAPAAPAPAAAAPPPGIPGLPAPAPKPPTPTGRPERDQVPERKDNPFAGIKI